MQFSVGVGAGDVLHGDPQVALELSAGVDRDGVGVRQGNASVASRSNRARNMSSPHSSVRRILRASLQGRVGLVAR